MGMLGRACRGGRAGACVRGAMRDAHPPPMCHLDLVLFRGWNDLGWYMPPWGLKVPYPLPMYHLKLVHFRGLNDLRWYMPRWVPKARIPRGVSSQNDFRGQYGFEMAHDTQPRRTRARRAAVPHSRPTMPPCRPRALHAAPRRPCHRATLAPSMPPCRRATLASPRDTTPHLLWGGGCSLFCGPTPFFHGFGTPGKTFCRGV